MLHQTLKETDNAIFQNNQQVKLDLSRVYEVLMHGEKSDNTSNLGATSNRN